MGSEDLLWEFTRESRVAYFSMEIALRPDIPTYSGGLGVLAGDTVSSAADLDIPLVAVSLVSRSGYFRQSLTRDGEQRESPDPWDPAAHAQPLGARVGVILEDRLVWVTGWLYTQKGLRGAGVPVILLDTHLPENAPDDRTLTDFLYGGDQVYRLKQEMVLGVGGVRLLAALDFQIRHYHMNEGHAALLALELLRRTARPGREIHPGESSYDLPRVREMCIFTTHTPVEAALDRFDYALFRRIAGMPVDEAMLRQLAGENEVNLTRLGLNVAEYVNGVAERHAQTTRRMFPGFTVAAIANGVHPRTWTCSAFARLYDEHLPGWQCQPERLAHAEYRIPGDAVRRAHADAKAELLAEIAGQGPRFDPSRLTIGFARRMTGYKRPDLLFFDLDRLREIARRHPLQLVFAGKAHPRDAPGRSLIQALHRSLAAVGPDIAAVYLPNYDLRLAKILVAGVDLWLNTPQPPLEASGTSGMKAAFNGVPSLSVLDGWWLEGHVEGVTGWAIGDGVQHDPQIDAVALYEKLERAVLPRFHAEPHEWTSVMLATISRNASLFHSDRMMHRYAVDAYLH